MLVVAKTMEDVRATCEYVDCSYWCCCLILPLVISCGLNALLTQYRIHTWGTGFTCAPIHCNTPFHVGYFLLKEVVYTYGGVMVPNV